MLACWQVAGKERPELWMHLDFFFLNYFIWFGLVFGCFWKDGRLGLDDFWMVLFGCLWEEPGALNGLSVD